VAGGEMTPPELAEFQNENENENENEYSFDSSSLHPFFHHRMAINKQYLLSRKLKTTLNLLMRQEPWCLLEDAQE